MSLFETAIKAAGSKAALAGMLGMIPAQLSHHYQFLKKGEKVQVVAPVPGLNNCDFTDKELDARIREMYGGRYEAVKVYKITDGYVPGQMGNEGLEFLRNDVSQTSLSYWARGGMKA